MKRRDFITSAGLGVAGAAVAAPAIAQSMPEIKWRMTSSFRSRSTRSTARPKCSPRLWPKRPTTNSRFRSLPRAKIVPALQAADAVSNGTVEMCHTASYYYVGKDPTFAFGTAVPFGLNSRMQTAWLQSGGGSELMNEFYKKYNIIAFLAGNTGCQMGGWFRKEIKEPADLKGPEDAHRRLRRAGVVKARPRAAAAWCAGHLSCAREGDHRRRRVGRTL